jgi:hypothetical protein
MASKERPALNGISALYKQRLEVERGIVPADDAFRERYPAVFAYLTQTAISATKVIDGSYLRFTSNAGDWCASLGVPALGAFADVLASTFNEALDRLEGSLASGKCDWRWSVKRRPRLRDLRKEEKSS